METVVQPPADADLNLLTSWGDEDSRPRARRAAILSVCAHAAVILGLALIPPGGVQPHPPAEAHIVTPLIEPPTQLTQKAPNTAKVTKEFEAAEVQPRPRIHIPAGSPRRPLVIPPAPPPKPQAAPLPEAPKVQAAIKAPVPADLPPLPVAPPPQIQATEQKPVLETPSAPPEVAPGQNRLPIPDTSVAGAVRQAIRSSSSGAGMVIGDSGAGGPGGAGAGLNLPPSPASRPSNIQLLSDPLGVDFRPYLTQILTIVRRNWFSVMPQSAKLGLSGRVGVLFAIAKDGSVTKANFASQSGARALDQAAIAAISMSNPFPPLPGEFRGNRIVLQFNFAYNMPR